MRRFEGPVKSKHRWTICGLYALVVLGVSIIPSSALEDAPKLFPHQDKVVHVLMYGILAGLLFWALQVPARHNPRAWIRGGIVIATIYGALMEVLQGVLVWVNRDCSWGDMLADLVGVVLAVGLLAWRRRCR